MICAAGVSAIRFEWAVNPGALGERDVVAGPLLPGRIAEGGARRRRYVVQVGIAEGADRVDQGPERITVSTARPISSPRSRPLSRPAWLSAKPALSRVA